MQRRHRDRLQCASKRRSTATCSSRDKEMEGVALESLLQNFLSSRGSRRRPTGRPSSTFGSPTEGSPRNGSLTEITSQANVPPEEQKKGELIILKELTKKEWNSAVELTHSSSPMQLNEEAERKSSGQENSNGSVPLVNLAASTASSEQSLSVDAKEDELKDNSEEEAQKLREASRKVLRFQNSRGSVSSTEFSLENQMSPGARSKLPRQRTFDEETACFSDDATSDDLARLVMGPEASSKGKFGRRHTLPSKVATTERKEDNSQKERETLAAERLGSEGSDCDDASIRAQKKSKPSASAGGPATRTPEGRLPPEDETNSEEVSSKGAWSKLESSGLFSGLLKRLGDMSK